MADGEWSNQRREVSYQEARAVIDAQNDTMADIDDKAMRTVRLNAILVGLFITAIQYTPGTFHETAVTIALGLFVLSAISGIATYDESNLYVGPRGDYIETLANGSFDDRRWDEDFLKLFAGMISENHNDLIWNAWLLKVTLSTLVLGVISGLVSVLI